MKLYLFIFGGRDYNNWPYFQYAVSSFILSNRLNGFEIIIVEGGARGADYMARRFAQQMGLEYITFEADWKSFHKAAGMIRNREMANVSHEAIGFWDGFSRGTGDSVKLCSNLGIPLDLHYYTNSLN